MSSVSGVPIDKSEYYIEQQQAGLSKIGFFLLKLCVRLKIMRIKAFIKKITPYFLLDFYHYLLAFLGAVVFRFPSSKLIVIGVTGTSGKSTTVDFITRILEEDNGKVASISSIRFKIGKNEWKNNLKMTMPGRFKIQKFLRQAVKEKCKYAVLEVTSEGVKQHRHRFINFNTAVFTNLSKEHIESHGGLENYRNEKLKLFKITKNLHIINADDENADYFARVPAKKKYFFSTKNVKADLRADDITSQSQNIGFYVNGVVFILNLSGEFNVYNALAAIAVAQNYGISLATCKKALEKISGIPGRMEVIQKEPFMVIVDYAHTPDQLESVYKSLDGKDLVCVLGSCGGGRDKWKRPVLGKIAGKYCREIIITNEDPYDEDPKDIIDQVAEGAKGKGLKIIDRKEAIKKAIKIAQPGDKVVITGKGSESLMCLENGKKIAWDDREIAKNVLKQSTIDK